MSDPLIEMAEFAGKACGTIVNDVSEFSRPLAEAFRRGWRQAMEEKPKADPAPSSAREASDPA